MDFKNIGSIPISLIFWIVVSGLMIFVLFVFVEKYYIAFVKKKKDYSEFYRLIAKVKLGFWFVWFAISLYFLLLASPIVTIVFLIGLYLFTRDFWANIYAGVFLMNKIKEGDYIFISNLDIGGIVQKLLFSDIEIQKENKELVYVPYSLITNSPIIKKERSDNFYLNDFVISIKEENGKADEKGISRAIFNCPWTINSKPIDIEFLDNDKARIRVYTFSKDTAMNQKDFIQSALD